MNDFLRTLIINLFEYPKGGILIFIAGICALWIIKNIRMILKKENQDFINHRMQWAYLIFVILTFIWVLSNAYFEILSFVDYAGETFAYWMYAVAGLSFTWGIIVFYYLTSIIDDRQRRLSGFQKGFIIFLFIQSVLFALLPNMSITEVFVEDGIAFAEYQTTRGFAIDILHTDFLESCYSSGDTAVTDSEETPKNKEISTCQRIGDFPFGEFIFYIFAMIGILAGFWNLLLAHMQIERNTKIEKKQFGYIALGVVGMYSSAIIYHMIYPVFFRATYEFQYAWIPPALSIFIILIIGYGIMVYRFFNLRYVSLIIAKKILAFCIGLAFVYFATKYCISIFPESRDSLPFLFVRTVTFLMLYVYTLRFLENESFDFLMGKNNPKFFQKKVHEFSEKKTIYSNLPQFMGDLQHLFHRTLGISFCKILFFEQKNKEKYSYAYEYMKQTKSIIITSEVEMNRHYGKIQKNLEELGELSLPLLNGKQEIMGVFCLGEKESHTLYTREEIQSIENIQVYLSLEINNLLSQKQLQKEVRRKTKSLNEKKKELEKSYKELKKLDESKDFFLAMASHELRTPLTIIRGNADFLCSDRFDGKPEIQKKFSHKILRSSTQVLDIVNDILDVSRMEAGKMEFRVSIFNIREFCSEIIQRYIPLSEKKNIKMILDIEKNFPKEYEFDEGKLRQIIDNLMSNALKFTEEGSITLRCWKEDEMLQFSVQDTGIGIADEDQEHIFEKFGQSENYLQKSVQGTGLGLVIVKKIIAIAGGKVWVESKKEAGATFRFYLPEKCHFSQGQTSASSE